MPSIKFITIFGLFGVDYDGIHMFCGNKVFVFRFLSIIDLALKTSVIDNNSSVCVCNHFICIDADMLPLLDQFTLSIMFRKPTRSRQRRAQKLSDLNSSDPQSAPPSRSVSPLKSAATSHLLLPSDIPQPRRPRHSRNMFLPGPQVLITVPGEEYTQQASPSRGRMPRSGGVSLASTSTDPSHFAAADADFGPDLMHDIFVDNTHSDELRRQRQRLKKQKQWSRWTDQVIPSLVHPYLHLLKISESMRSTPPSENIPCNCRSGVRHLKIVCVYLESKSIVG